MACDDGQDTQDPLEGADKSGMTDSCNRASVNLYCFKNLIKMCLNNIFKFESLSQCTNVSFWIMCCADKVQATLSLGMDLNLDWMTLDDFQKHLNGEDEILSGPPLSPSEYISLLSTIIKCTFTLADWWYRVFFQIFDSLFHLCQVSYEMLWRVDTIWL